ncbi:hypothetical protein ABAC460_20615 [Asticcacaulis sp. AC460]|uniref:M10 family metallopeptidase C-terminal domain-containing protein n=1 Tax=Asticcacaulis sp. AC460 TaxID=1282360 RepID=UPI0003C3C898|nr:M10 family metallopeptidase C-terminal domain-containing protein [Asticcacaulis sp. AC460]ESQ87177.1 hypothetical protein ABAC460_20615 [Asticcacaulis sp. AC460]
MRTRFGLDFEGAGTASGLVLHSDVQAAMAAPVVTSAKVPVVSVTTAGFAHAGVARSAGVNDASGEGMSAPLDHYFDVEDGRWEYTGNQDVDAILIGSKWTVTEITFSFPTSGEVYGEDYAYGNLAAEQVTFNTAQQNAARYAFGLMGSYTNLVFTEITETAETHAIIRLSQTASEAVPSAQGNFPGSDAEDGDIWFGMSGQPFYLTPAIGNWGQATMMHEIGHTMGLKHGHDNYTAFDLSSGGYVNSPVPYFGSAALPGEHDGQAWSLMTYRSNPGAPVSFQGEQYNQPQTYMQNDIAALQYLYGANFTTNATSSVYNFDGVTGEMFINGVSQGVPERPEDGVAKVLRTVWDGGGHDTYNLANFNGNQSVDLRPGGWVTFNTAQLANHQAYSGGVAIAPGNVANALLFEGNERSLIEDAITGNGDDVLIGNQIGNWLIANGGNDYLDGGIGGDSMEGGLGDDTYVVDTLADTVVELAGQGNDTIVTGLNFSLAGKQVENLVLTGAANINGTGNGSKNILVGNLGSNVLSAGAGHDLLYNGYINVSYDAAAITDIALPLHNTPQTALAIAPGAFDLQADANIDQSTSVLHATINGLGDGNVRVYSFTVDAAGVTGYFDIDGTVPEAYDSLIAVLDSNGNLLSYSDDGAVNESGGSVSPLDSYLIYQFAAAGTYYIAVGGYADGDIGPIPAGAAYTLNISLEGNSFLSLPDDGGSHDTLIGGTGNDSYYAGTHDTIVEAASEGTDTVFAGSSVTLGANVENLTLTGSRNINGTGNALDNVLTGNAGVNVLSGGAGNDTYYVQNSDDRISEASGAGTDAVFASVSYSIAGRQVENLTLTGTGDINATGNTLGNVMTGNAGVNTLDGGAGHDRLDGGAGADSLIGGSGHDTYVVDHAGDAISELAGGGRDLVLASVSYTLGANVEQLTLTGARAIDGTGNALNNVLTGNGNKNILTGGLGNDTYYVQNAVDNVVELAGEGNDVIYSTVTYSLSGRYAEVLNLTGTAHINATGNELANTLAGNEGNNTLNGVGGKDVLTGGLGADIFLFQTGSGLDTVTDFSAAQNDSLNIHAYTNGVETAGLVTQSGLDVRISLSAGNVITVSNAVQADVLAHIVW